MHRLSEEARPKAMQDIANRNNSDIKPFFTLVKLLWPVTDSICRQISMDSVRLRRRVRIETADQFPVLSREACLFLKLTTRRLFKACIRRVNRSTWQFEQRLVGRMTVLVNKHELVLWR